jgi:hypothetical protein
MEILIGLAIVAMVTLFWWRHWQHESRRAGWRFVPDPAYAAPPRPMPAPPAHVEPVAAIFPLLKLRAPFTREEAIAAFRRRSLVLHPDHGGSAALFQILLAERDRALMTASQ